MARSHNRINAAIAVAAKVASARMVFSLRIGICFFSGKALPAHFSPAIFLSQKVDVTPDGRPYDERMKNKGFQYGCQYQFQNIGGLVVLVVCQHLHEYGKNGIEDAERKDKAQQREEHGPIDVS